MSVAYQPLCVICEDVIKVNDLIQHLEIEIVSPIGTSRTISRFHVLCILKHFLKNIKNITHELHESDKIEIQRLLMEIMSQFPVTSVS